MDRENIVDAVFLLGLLFVVPILGGAVTGTMGKTVLRPRDYQALLPAFVVISFFWLIGWGMLRFRNLITGTVFGLLIWVFIFGVGFVLFVLANAAVRYVPALEETFFALAFTIGLPGVLLVALIALFVALSEK